MKANRQHGHAFSVTMILMILFSLLSLSALRNGLLDLKIAHTFIESQKSEERLFSVLRHVEQVTLRRLFNPGSDLNRSFSTLEPDQSLEIDLSYASIFDATALQEMAPLASPSVNISQAATMNATTLETPSYLVLRAVIHDQERSTQLHATFGIPFNLVSGEVEVDAIKRMSVRKLS
ncbi:MAG: hypothetical protein KTR18_03875 [Acidiferrobacterales bacterium]|nr:hypothetical protein [Acidiferrobacterales bacterium]